MLEMQILATRYFHLQHPVTRSAHHGDSTRVKRAGIEDFRWHDLRHTWASWHVQSGTPLHALQELGGWESSEMVRRYAHFSADHLAPYADRLCALRVVDDPAVGTNWSQAGKSEGAA
jgi:integrase